MAKRAKVILDESQAILDAGAGWEPEKAIDPASMLSTGISLLDLQISGVAGKAIPAGWILRYYGGTSSGKTLQMLLLLANAAKHPYYANHRFVYQDAEYGANFDPRLFGKKLHDRLEWTHPSVLEEAYFEAYNIMEDGPAIIVTDSIDALSSKAAKEKYEKKADAKTQKARDAVAGMFGNGQAVVNSEHLKHLIERVHATNSIMVLISQERTDFKSQFGGKKASGGDAPGFYVSMELHTAKIGTIYSTVNKEKIPIGTRTKVVVEKNRVRGCPRASAEFPIYGHIGPDNVGASVDWLVKHHWTDKPEPDPKAKGRGKKPEPEDDDDDESSDEKKAAKRIVCPEFGMQGSREAMVRHIQADPARREKLDTILSEVWRKRQDAVESRVQRVCEYE